jgi:hypothetical protein
MITSLNFLTLIYWGNSFFQLCQKLQSWVQKTQGILRVNNYEYFIVVIYLYMF